MSGAYCYCGESLPGEPGTYGAYICPKCSLVYKWIHEDWPQPGDGWALLSNLILLGRAPDPEDRHG